MSQDIYRVGDIIRQDMQEILAFGQNQLAQELGRRKTASEATIINQYAQLRSDERRDIIGDFISRSVTDVNRLLFKFWDTEDVVRVVGEEGMEWETWNGEFLAGEYAIRTIPNSTLPMTKEMFQQKTTELLSKYRNDPYINQKELHRLDLDAYEEFDTNKLLVPDPSQPQVMMNDFRPGKGKRGEGEGGPEGSRINIPENPQQQMLSQMMGQQQGAGPGGAPSPGQSGPELAYPIPGLGE
jgi:hypothetical protein